MTADGFVDGHASGWTELRVHGVAGTPAADVLQHPHVALAAGYTQAGFFRRWWEARSTAPDTAWSRREAYSWGGLTSGDNTRALWLLLLPFMLLNVAYFMTPSRSVPGRAPRATRFVERVSGSVQSLLALSFTATFALSAVTVAMDLVGWQCAQGRAPGCGRWYLTWLMGWAPLAPTGRQLAVTALAPLVVVGLLWWLARTTWRNLEAVDVTQSSGPGGPDVRTPLEDRALWNGRAAVRRLRALHVALGLALPGVFTLAPLDAAPRLPRTVLLALLLALVVLVVVLAALPWTRRRTRPVAGEDPAERRRAEQADPMRYLPWAALGLTVLALVVAAVPAGTVDRPASTLPWLVGTELWLFAGQAILLVVLLGVALVLRRPAPAPPPCGPGGTRVDVTPAWRGLAMPGIALLAWVLAGGISAGAILRVAQTLGTPVSRGQRSADMYPLVIPSAVSWAAVGGLVLGVVALVTGLLTWRRVRHGALRSTPRVTAAYPEARGTDPPVVERRDQIARAWDVAGELPRVAQHVAGFLVVAVVVVVLLGIAGFLVVGPGLLSAVPGLVEAADVAISGFVLLLIAVGRQAYRNPATRRTVGILWDLGTFWPRAVHPLAPPCYAERAIPDLLQRVAHYARSGGRVLLSCHSQGTVLGAAVLLQVETAVSARVAFLTYGSPLTRLYVGFFPAYFSPTVLDRLGGFLAEPGGADRSRWRWRNLYRPSDPIGGPVFCAREPGPDDEDPGDVDRVLRDPVFARASGDPCYPAILGHSNYFADPAFGATTAALRDGRLPSR